ncbi:hypothetical protein SAMN05444405_101292 [Bacteroides luti]|uniref:Uncharacterized protein n=1 Tax=Bacteroides luti TaxID=1297750 RepID=A0A1M4T5Z4_9BACE|nr:hypothetical protein SAMN05444405_101292 [Bacteroides luti]
MKAIDKLNTKDGSQKAYTKNIYETDTRSA